MSNIIIPGVSTTNSDGHFHFKSGLPMSSQIIDHPLRRRGTMVIKQNAEADFMPDKKCISLPPQMCEIGRGEDYLVKRTTRNYIIQVKVPIIENRRETEHRLRSNINEIVGCITIDRHEILKN